MTATDRNTCTCPHGPEFDPNCPWARNFDGTVLGHVKACPDGGKSCPCLPGSLSEAMCHADARGWGIAGGERVA